MRIQAQRDETGFADYFRPRSTQIVPRRVFFRVGTQAVTHHADSRPLQDDDDPCSCLAPHPTHLVAFHFERPASPREILEGSHAVFLDVFDPHEGLVGALL